MIEFHGLPSKEVRRNYYKYQTILALLLCSIIAIIVGVPIVIVACYTEPIIALLAAPCLLSVVCCVFAFRFRKDVDDFTIPFDVCIQQTTLTTEGKEFYQTRDMVDVKKVYDYGEYYFITFYFPAKSQQFICQKDLLVSGTIEEFEDLFAGKIVRKKTKAKTAE